MTEDESEMVRISRERLGTLLEAERSIKQRKFLVRSAKFLLSKMWGLRRFLSRENLILVTERLVIKFNDHNRIPVKETGEFVASLYGMRIRRAILIGVAVAVAGAIGGAIASAIPTYFAWRQTDAIKIQNSFFKQQIELQEDQEFNSQRARLFGVLCDTKWGIYPGTNCGERNVPIASPRTRIEAAAALLRMTDLHYSPRGGRLENEQGLWPLDLSGARLQGIDLYDPASKIYQVVAKTNPDFSGLHLMGARLSMVRSFKIWVPKFGARTVRWKYARRFRRQSYREWDFTAAILDYVDFAEKNLFGACFDSASISQVRFEGADCRNVSFQHAFLRASTFNNETKLDGAKFASADLTFVDFRGVNLLRVKELSVDSIRLSFWDKRTVWPDGFFESMKDAGLPDERLPPLATK